MTEVIITGVAGFIGFAVAQRLLDEGYNVVGIDCMSDYYDVNLKKPASRYLLKVQNFSL